jgi:hypothetical protein
LNRSRKSTGAAFTRIKEKSIGESINFELCQEAGGRGGTIGTTTVSFSVPNYHVANDRAFWTDPEAPAAYIRKVAVLPAFIKLGVAPKLITFAEEDYSSPPMIE